jgi:hypothetical protein
MIREKGLIFREVIVSVILRNVSHDHVSNDQIQLFESPDLTPLDFCLRGWWKSKFHKRKVDTWDKLLARILDAVAGVRKGEDQLKTNNALRSALTLMVGFSNTYCEL